MPRGKKGTRKGTKKGGKASTKRRAPRKAIPAFATFVNSNAGVAATGVRVGFPAQRTVMLNYAEYIIASGTSGAFATYQFRLNSAYDPNYTSAGHQPMGFDQWSQFYNHYVVESCSYDVAMAGSTANAISMMAHLSDDATVPTVVNELIELGAETHLYVPTTPAHIFRGHVDMAKFFNRGAIASDSDLRATVTANPTDAAMLSLLFVSATSGADTATVAMMVKLTMKVRFMEPKDLAPSRLSASMERTARQQATHLADTPDVYAHDNDIVVGPRDLPIVDRPEYKSFATAQELALRGPLEAARRAAEAASYAAHHARLDAIRAARLDELNGPEYTLVTRKGSRSHSGSCGA